VAGEIHPTSDSHIGFEVWLPLEAWNQKLGGVGVGGWGGYFQYDYSGTGAGPLIRNAKPPFGFTLSDQLKRGYATAATDTGHRVGDRSDDVAFAVGHPERLVDYGYRAVHETAVVARALVLRFYARAPEHAYWVGQSTGGEQGLQEAQRFPDDYDGIVIGTPNPNPTWNAVRVVDVTSAVTNSGLDAAHRSFLHKAVVAACDADDGLTDELINDPPRCAFDPSTLVCPSGVSDTQSCLTAAQVAAVRRVYDGLRDPQTGRQLAPGLSKGSELGWGQSFQPAGPRPPNLSFMRSVVFQDPAWDWRTFDLSRAADRDVIALRERIVGPILNADNADLRAFRQRGGKILHFQGWADPLAVPANSTAYYDSVVRALGGTGGSETALRQVPNFYRLFMVPGMVHGLGNGYGPATFDLLTALEDWVERGKAPDSLVATEFDEKGVAVRSRPLCSYPAVVHYRGSGDVNQAASFLCRE
jgi:feruloyl esterase